MDRHQTFCLGRGDDDVVRKALGMAQHDDLVVISADRIGKVADLVDLERQKGARPASP